MDGQTRLLSLLERVLGASRKTGKSNYIFHCPRCNHRKPKLEINIENQYYHCWVCDTDLKGRTMGSLFKKLNVDRTIMDELNAINKAYGVPEVGKTSAPTGPVMIQLPAEARPLWIEPDNKGEEQERRRALAYLFGPKRRLTWPDIIKYQMHYCSSGKYRGMVVIPSYDESGVINYFFARSYVNDFKLNPAGSRDVIMFESNINWNFPITLVEGMFDAIACKRNTIPLGGKAVLPKLRMKLREKKVTDIYVALDEDARKDQLVMVNMLMRDGYSVHLVDTSSGDPEERGDPDNLGYEEMRRRIEHTPALEFKDLIQLKLE